MIFRRRADLKLASDAAGRFLPSVIAIMVFLGALSAAGAIVLDQAMTNWGRSVAGTLTVEVGSMTSPDAAARVATAVELLRATPGIAEARPLDKAAVDRLLEPWLGEAMRTADLPVPALIDVRLAPDATVDTGALGRRLAEAVPGAALDDHKPWLANMVRFARTLQGLAFVVVGLIGLATVALVVFATRAGLAVHREVIEVLHLIGARDAYIAAEFQRYTLRLAALGALIGLVGAALVLAVLARYAASLEAPLLPAVHLGLREGGMLLAVALVAMALATVTARVTVMRSLQRMP